MRALHTLKGNAAVFGFHHLASRCHNLENELAESGGGVTEEQIADLYRDLEVTVRQVKVVFGDDFLSLIEVRERDLSRLANALQERREHTALLAMVESWRDESVDAVLNRFAAQASRIATGLGKEIDVVVDDDGARVPRGALRGFWSGLVHAIRNAIDHGIETPDERLDAGKPQRGRLVLRARSDGHRLTLELEDDGRGIDFDALRRAADRKGLPCATRSDLLEAMFADGVSSRTEATELSGRGVGMAALREACVELGGSLAVETHRGAGTRFTFHIPVSRPPTAMLRPSVAA
jgi:chemotaxis protein histidine kinase CheA